MRFSLNQYICPQNYPVDKFINIASNVGAKAVGLSSETLKSIEARHLKLKLKKSNVKVSSLNSVGYFIYKNKAQQQNQFKKNIEIIQFASEIEAKTVCVITGGISNSNLSIENARNEILIQLNKLCNKANQYGVTLGLEPIHPVDLYSKGCINTLRSAVKLIDEISNLRIVLDLFHSWWDPDLLHFIDKYIDKISLIQFCNTLHSYQNLKPIRNTPLEGPINVLMILNRIHKKGYDNYYEFELFNQDLQGKDFESVIKIASNDFSMIKEKII